MAQYEYRIEYLKLEKGRKNSEQMLEAMNTFGREGWRFIRLYGEVSLRNLTSWKGGFNLLLERAIEE